LTPEFEAERSRRRFETVANPKNSGLNLTTAKR
jgi:hypothetical protein